MISAGSRRARWTIAVVGILIIPSLYFLRPLLERNPASVCTFKNITGTPCLFCGLTRALAAAAHGDFGAATEFNSLWWLAALVVVLVSLLALHDAIKGKDSLRLMQSAWRIASWPVIALLIGVALYRLLA